MKIGDIVFTALNSLNRTRSRSLLTILGIVIGIGAVIVMLSIGQGAQGLILNQVADLGSDLIFVEPSSGESEGGPPRPFIEQTINLDDEIVLERSGLFSAVSPSLYTTVPVIFQEFNSFTQLVGTDEEQTSIFPAEVALGRNLEAEDVSGNARVVVLGKEIADDFFGASDPLGQRIKIKDLSFRVIGVFGEQGTRFFQNLDKQVFIPVTTMQNDILGVDYVNYLSAISLSDIETTKEDLKILLRDAHNIENPEGLTEKDDFLVSSQTDATKTVGTIGNVLTILLSSIAAISLLVGGIGIMNIMLVSVTERTREIGLRKAVGATNQEVLRQFLIEAILLTMLGGLIGVIGGVLISLAMGWIIQNFFLDTWSVIIPPSAIVLSVVVATAIGLIFGYYPAKSAAKLNPIEALRYE